jgi:hypothetical protein
MPLLFPDFSVFEKAPQGANRSPREGIYRHSSFLEFRHLALDEAPGRVGAKENGF